MLIPRMARAALDCLWPSGAMITTDPHPESGGVHALGTTRLTLCRAALGFACGNVGEGHQAVFLNYISRSARRTGTRKLRADLIEVAKMLRLYVLRKLSTLIILNIFPPI